MWPKMQQSCPQFGNVAQNVANMPTLWQSSVAIVSKIWPTYPQCVNLAQNVANMPTVWQYGPNFS